MKKFLFLVACFSQFVFAGEVDQYFNGGSTLYDATTFSSASVESGVVVDLYDNVITFHYDSGSNSMRITKMDEGGALIAGTGDGVTAFNSSGNLVFTPDGAGTLSNFRMTTDPTNGDIFVAYVAQDSGSSTIYAQKRLAANGALDTTFATDGKISFSADPTIAVGSPSVVQDGDLVFGQFSDVLIDSNGNIIFMVFGHIAENPSNYIELAVWRFTSAGVLDKDGSAYALGMGIIQLNVIFSAAIDSSDNLYVSWVNTGYSSIGIKKFSIGSSALEGVTTAIRLIDDSSSVLSNADEVSTIHIDLDISNGNLQAVIYTEGDSTVFIHQVSLSDLSSDTTFSSSGRVEIVITSIKNASTLGFYDSIRNSDGDLFLSGRVINTASSDYDLVLAKITTKGVLDETFGDSFGLVKSGSLQLVSSSDWSIFYPMCAIDSGDGLTVFSQEFDSSNYNLATKRFLGADHVNLLLDINLLAHIDLVELANYSNDVDFLKSYHNIDSKKGSLSTAWGLLSINKKYINLALNAFDAAVTSAFNKDISRASANSFKTCMAMKYKRGVMNWEINAVINSSLFTTFSLMETKLNDVLAQIASEFDAVRALMISEEQ